MDKVRPREPNRLSPISQTALGLLTFATIACGSPQPPVKKPEIQPTRLPVVATATSEAAQKLQGLDANIYYPEMANTPIASGARIDFSTVDVESRRETKKQLAYFNYDKNLLVNNTGLREAIRFFNRFTSSDGSAKYPLSINGKPYEAQLYNKNPDTVLYFVPPTAPKPHWMPKEAADLPDVIFTSGFERTNVAIVKTIDYEKGVREGKIPEEIFISTNDEWLAKTILFTICDSLVKPQSNDYPFAEGLSQSFCDSLSTAFFMRQKGVTYDEYKKYVMGVRYAGGDPIIIIDEPNYLSIQQFGMPVYRAPQVPAKPAPKPGKLF